MWGGLRLRSTALSVELSGPDRSGYVQGSPPHQFALSPPITIAPVHLQLAHTPGRTYFQEKPRVLAV